MGEAEIQPASVAVVVPTFAADVADERAADTEHAAKQLRFEGNPPMHKAASFAKVIFAEGDVALPIPLRFHPTTTTATAAAATAAATATATTTVAAATTTTVTAVAVATAAARCSRIARRRAD